MCLKSWKDRELDRASGEGRRRVYIFLLVRPASNDEIKRNTVPTYLVKVMIFTGSVAFLSSSSEVSSCLVCSALGSAFIGSLDFWLIGWLIFIYPDTQSLPRQQS